MLLMILLINCVVYEMPENVSGKKVENRYLDFLESKMMSSHSWLCLFSSPTFKYVQFTIIDD